MALPRLLELYAALLSAEALAALLASLEQPLRPALRVNSLKAAATAPLDWAADYGWSVQPVPFCASGWQLAAPAPNLSRTVEHQLGHYYIQDAASMAPPELFTFTQAAPLVLDMAAAPGGKTTHLVSRLGDQGLVVANDGNPQRCAALTGNLQRWGSLSTVVVNHPGERLGRWFPEIFDAVLLDAPCSGEALRTSERHTSRLISSHERSSLQQRQIRLLESGLLALKPGGQLVYATCSLAPDEDEAVLAALLATFPGAISVTAVRPELGLVAPALTALDGQPLPAEIGNALRLWPQLYDTAGFFTALITKHDSLPVQRLEPPQRSWLKQGYKALASAEETLIATTLRECYGFDLAPLLTTQELWKHGRQVLAMPQRWRAQFGDSPFVAVGLPMGRLSRQEFQPAHELVTRFPADFPGQRLRIAAAAVPAWLAREPLRLSTQPYAPGSMVIVEDPAGRVLGCGRTGPDTLENLAPRWH